jgi:hypothetical protein
VLHGSDLSIAGPVSAQRARLKPPAPPIPSRLVRDHNDIDEAADAKLDRAQWEAQR